MALLLRATLARRSGRCVREVSVLRQSFANLDRYPKWPQCCCSIVGTNGFRTSTGAPNTSESANDKLLIYTGLLKPKIRNVKILSFATSVTGLLVQPFLLRSAVEDSNLLGILGVSFIFLLFTVGSPVLIHLMVKRYVTAVYYDETRNEYDANTYSFFLRQKEIKFREKDVKPLELTGMFTNCLVKGTPLFLDRQSFTDPAYYDKIMGFRYDKVFPLEAKGILDARRVGAEETRSPSASKDRPTDDPFNNKQS